LDLLVKYGVFLIKKKHWKIKFGHSLIVFLA